MTTQRSSLSFIINSLYTNKNLNWINDINVNEIQPFIIQRVLVMNPYLRENIRWLDKYVFSLQNKPKMYLSLVWSIIPKSQKAPFYRYIGEKKTEEEFEFLFEKIRKHYNLSDNDFNSNKKRLIVDIKKDMVNWFSFYGVPKKYWKKYYLDFDILKTMGEQKTKSTSLDKWGF